MEKEVTVYTTKTCHYCHEAMKWMDDNKIPYKEIDIGADKDQREHLMNITNQMGVPVFNIGDTWIIGYNKPKLEEMLGGARITAS